MSEISREIRAQMTAQTIAITQLLSRVVPLNPDGHLRTRRIMFDKMWEEVDDDARDDSIDGIVAEIEMLDVSGAAETKTRTTVQNGILRGLHYPTMSDRYEEVLEAHAETFEWAFHDSTAEQQTWSNLSHWLKADSGIYWVSGKAGSGKSTFMKHIYDDGRTLKYLEEWANKVPLCVATFFFWNSGPKEQKSQSGLLRALIFQVLQKHPELGPVIFPATWTRLYSRAVSQPSNAENDTESWSLKQLTAAFRAVIHQKRFPLKICFLIDGLDEFDGDHEEIASLFQEICRSPNIKVCLSSRPWVIFQYLFGNCPNLRLQNLTYPDIERYVQDKLAGNSAFQRLAEDEREAAPALAHEIVEKADGVFLWVKLVVGSLLNGIRNRDAISDLWERLRLLPRELEPLYNRLLDLVDPIYLGWVSKTFQILRTNRELGESPFPESSAETSGVEALTVLAFHLAMNKDFDPAKLSELDRDTLKQTLYTKCNDAIVHLTARCVGLLEVSNERGTGTTGKQSFIRYFHRTARDFLHTDAHWSKIQKQTTNTQFNPNVCMMQSCILQTLIHYKIHQEGEITREKRENPLAYPDFDFRFPRCSMDEETKAITKDFMIYAHYADAQSETLEVQSEMIDQFNNLLVQNWINGLFPSLWGFPTFLELAATYNFRGYVGSKFRQPSSERTTSHASNLLRYIIPDKDCHAKHGLPLPQVTMVSLLLRLGADPNKRGRSWSPWENALRFFMINKDDEIEEIDIWTAEPKKRYDSRPLQLRYLQIMDLLVLSGANSEACITIYEHGTAVDYTPLRIVEDFIIKKFPQEAAPILRGLQHAMQLKRLKTVGKRQRDAEEECEIEGPRKKKERQWA